MDIDPLPPLPRGRKRAASSSPPCEGPDAFAGAEYRNGGGEADAHAATRARVTSELDTLGVIPRDEAWQLDLRQLLEGEGENGNGLVVLCVGELGMKVVVDVVRSTFPSLKAISPGLQAFVIASSQPNPWPSPRSDRMETNGGTLPCDFPGSHLTTFPFTTINPANPSRTFTRLGLLHPLGGGREALDAIVLLDRQGRRRLVLPFGWGSGRHVRDAAGGWIVRERFFEVLVKAVGELELEWMGEIEARYRNVMAA
ncbi:hypothetical protein NA57DRAFT_56733 [Rhizodiscina lignyota]|uniref:Uncharacterized protein n=1 Tax=Rhizodiscina lignyota TaxID=1504668 RepID=A0A9P4ICN1_9PEZI|nr:hypothetical protein NA57DRAFT_56733 [Rhizodiscina lignyota]